MKKIGLVLEGGAMRGMFTAGILDVMMENGIETDGVIGVSAGATFGCNYKSKQIGRTIRYNIRYCKNWRYCSIRSLIFTGDLYGADFCYNVLPNQLDVFDCESYRNNPMEFFVVASDAETGLPVYKKLETCNESDLTWMRASASMPLASRPVSIDGYTLLDGGMTDSIPLKYFESIGYEKNIVVLTQPRDYVKEKASLLGLMKLLLWKYPKLAAAMAKRHEVYNYEKLYVFEKEKQGEVLVLCPEKKLGIKRTENNPSELKRVYEEGRKVAEKHLSQIKKFCSEKIQI